MKKVFANNAPEFGFTSNQFTSNQNQLSMSKKTKKVKKSKKSARKPAARTSSFGIQPVGDKVLVRTALTRDALAQADAVVVATNHTAFPWDEIASFAKLTIDTRGSVPKGQVTGILVPLSGPAFDGRLSTTAAGRGGSKDLEGARERS